MHVPTILFCMLPEGGHLNPTWKLARGLRARGLQVRYLLPPDQAPAARAQGFEVDLLFPDLFPEGVTAREEALGTLARRRAITARYQALLARLLETPRLIAGDVAPDLLVVDVTQTHFALWARRNGVPFVNLNTSLPQTRDPGVPPLRSASPYGEDVRARLTNDLEWRQYLAKRRWAARAATLGGMRPPYDLARGAAAAFGIPEGALDAKTVYMPQFRDVPELVLCPEAFDFPRPPQPNRHYVESLDLSRSDGELPHAWLSGDKPRVYCALGGTRYRADEVAPFFRRLIQVFRDRPKWQLLLAFNRYASAEDFADLPPNVGVVERAPQLAVLRRAHVMITHGGLGSVKECIAHAVPMLGVPLAVDQPGNVARVVHHGLGLREDIVRSSEQDLATSLSRLLEDPSFRQRSEQMRARFAMVEEAGRGVELLAAQVERAQKTPTAGGTAAGIPG